MPHDGKTSRSVENSRRRVLQLAGAGVAGLSAGLAGCSTGDGGDGAGGDGGGDGNASDGGGGDGGDGNASDGGDGGSKLMDGEFTRITRTVPSQLHYNPYNQKSYAGGIAGVLFDWLARYRPATKEFVPVLAKNWEIDTDANVATLELADDRTWHDGSEFTAEDVVVRLKLDKYVEDPVWDYLDSVEATGSHTVTLNLTSSVNPSVIWNNLLEKPIQTKKDMFQDKLTAIEEASEGARDEAVSDLLEYRIQDPVGNGPFQYDRTEQRDVYVTKFEEYPTADEINFDTIRFRHAEQGTTIYQYMNSDRIDGVLDLVPPKDVFEGFPDNWKHTMLPGYSGLGLTFNHERGPFSDRRVRKAVAHILNPTNVTKNSIPFNKKVIDTPTGMHPGANEEYLSDVIGDFTTYEQSQEKAAALLEKAGYAKQGGTWKKNGEPLKAPVKFPSGWAAWASGAQTIVSQLKQGGLQGQAVGREVTAYWGQDIANGDYQLSMTWWGSSYPYPYFGLRYTMGSSHAHNSLHYPKKVDVPETIGDPASSSTTVDLEKQFNQLAQTDDDAKAKEIIRQLSWTFNQTLPLSPFFQKIHPTWYTTDAWDFPPEDDPDMSIRYPHEWLLRVGKLKGVTE
jgi:peptide/nickel transport system substrate-binding protein